jgi:hypothetical protein
MDVNLSEKVNSLLLALFLLILPLVMLLAGLAFKLDNVWYYVLAITWFGCGLVLYGTVN